MGGLLAVDRARVGAADASRAARHGERWRSGNERLVRAALRWARRKLAPMLWRKYRCALSRDEVEALAALAVERAWERRAGFDSRKGDLKAWFWTIADRLALDELRSWWFQKRDRAMAALEGWQAALPDTHADAEGDEFDAQAPDIYPQVLLAMADCLSENEQAILLADAHSPEGVAAGKTLAESLDISTSNVYVLRCRARKKLAVELDKRGLLPDLARPEAGGDAHTHTSPRSEKKMSECVRANRIGTIETRTVAQ